MSWQGLLARYHCALVVCPQGQDALLSRLYTVNAFNKHGRHFSKPIFSP